jgi:predicted alpha/beta hydrolase
VRQLQDWKGSVSTDRMLPSSMAMYGQICGWTLARAHARSGDRIAIASYLGTSKAFDVTIAEFAERYADQNQRDFDALQAAVDSGRIVARYGI